MVLMVLPTFARLPPSHILHTGHRMAWKHKLDVPSFCPMPPTHSPQRPSPWTARLSPSGCPPPLRLSPPCSFCSSLMSGTGTPIPHSWSPGEKLEQKTKVELELETLWYWSFNLRQILKCYPELLLEPKERFFFSKRWRWWWHKGGRVWGNAEFLVEAKGSETSAVT